jgi:ubiquinone/menaquinone biosynthesis C-methylase UbiE
VIAASAELALQEVREPMALLDVGCGAGTLLRTLASRLPGTVDLAGVDPAPKMIEIGRASLKDDTRIRLQQGFAERLPFEDASFDLVVSTVSFHHWADQALGLREVARVLNVGGTLVLADHFAAGWLRVVNVIARRRMRTVGAVDALLLRAHLTPSRWADVFDLGPLPLIRAVIAQRHA